MYYNTAYLLIGEETVRRVGAVNYVVTPLGLEVVAARAHESAVDWVAHHDDRRVHIYSFDSTGRLEHVTCVCRVDAPWMSVLYGEGSKPHHRTALLKLLSALYISEEFQAPDEDVCDLAAEPPTDPTTARAGDCPTAPAAEVECNDPMCRVCRVRRHQTDPPMHLCRQCYDVFCARFSRPPVS